MKPFRPLLAAFASASLASCAGTGPSAPPSSANAAAEPEQTVPAALPSLVAQVDIPHETFTLPNGLTTIVHTDRKSPVVGVSVYYRVGSKHEPRGRTGFAHLFEHLMFTGSENVENFDIPLEAAGSTGTNGSTNPDRTNYIETVPTGALDLALFMESDRMGYLLGAIDQEKLDRQRGVVQNEKRQGDNQPYGLVRYKLSEGLFPVGHPYRHSTIGSMADLDAADLADVQKWFVDHYGPNNVVLALAGDIDAATARPMVERWFGAIPPGPQVVQPDAAPVTLAAPVREEITDQVPVTMILRAWTGPAITNPDAVPLAAGMHVLGGLASSRLDNALVRDEQVAVSVSASASQNEQISILIVQMGVKPGVDPAFAEERLGAVIADLLADGPNKDELTRAATQIISGQISALELVGGFGGKGATLAEGMLYASNPAHYKDELQALAALEPEQVRSAMQRWLSRPAYTLAVLPGERELDGALLGGWGDEADFPAPKSVPEEGTKQAAEPNRAELQPARSEPRTAPPVAPVSEVEFPAVEHAVLSNGIKVALARRTAIPKVSLMLSFDAGNAADGAARAGTQSLMMEMLPEGTSSRSSIEIAEEQERLGASIRTSTNIDTSSVSLTALATNLERSLALMADIVRNPAFASAEVSRVIGQRLAEIEQERASPTGLARRALMPLIYGSKHPYGTVGGTGDAAVISAITPQILAEEHRRWLRPDLATIIAVGDVTMDELIPALEAALGDWQAPSEPPATKDLSAATPPLSRKLVVVDRPGSPQSLLLFGRVLPLKGTDRGSEGLALANEVIGNGFLSRLNMTLREEKGWTYGINSQLPNMTGPRSLLVVTPVQADRTADSIRLIIDEMNAFSTTRGVADIELQRVTEGNIRGMPNRFQTNAQVLSALAENERLGRPDDYYQQLPEIYRALDAGAINAAARKYLVPDDMLIVVVGDRNKIDEQLEDLDLEIEYLEADDL